MASVRLRQVALVARRLAPVADRLREELALGPPYRDPGVGEFGLENAVFAVGDTFLEVVAPVREGTTAGRYLDRRGGDGGYMAIFQVPDVHEARRRVGALGVRVVWQADLDDIAGTHLHPKDVPGAIVSLDAADPPGTWRWAGPDWTGGEPQPAPGGIVGLNSREMVGFYRVAPAAMPCGCDGQRGFIYNEGAFTTVDVPGAISTSLAAVNRRGDIVGSYQDAAGRRHGVVIPWGAAK